MFEILGPMSKEMAADKINLAKKKKAAAPLTVVTMTRKRREKTCMFTDTPQISEHLHPLVALCCFYFIWTFNPVEQPRTVKYP